MYIYKYIDMLFNNDNNKNKKKKKHKKKSKKKKKKRYTSSEEDSDSSESDSSESESEKRRKKKKKKKKSKNAIKNKEIEYEPDFIYNVEGTAANHNPPSHVMGVSPQQLSNQIEMDKQHDKQKAIDMQSTVSSHPAFDAKNLKHFVDMVDPYTTNDGMHTEREHKEDDSEESMSSGTSNSDSDEYSYSTSNAEEYVPNDAMSLASADPYPLH
eukprot:168370_1